MYIPKERKRRKKIDWPWRWGTYPAPPALFIGKVPSPRGIRSTFAAPCKRQQHFSPSRSISFDLVEAKLTAWADISQRLMSRLADSSLPAPTQPSEGTESQIAPPAVTAMSSSIPNAQSRSLSPNSKAGHEQPTISSSSSDESGYQYLSVPDIEVDSDVSFNTRKQMFDADLIVKVEWYARHRLSYWLNASVSSRMKLYLLDSCKADSWNWTGAPLYHFERVYTIMLKVKNPIIEVLKIIWLIWR